MVPGFIRPGQEIQNGLRCGINVHINPKRCNISGPVIIAGGAHIADGVTMVGPCYIGSGARVEKGAHIESSIIMANTLIGSGANVVNMVTDGSYCMLDDATILDLSKLEIPWLVGDARTSRKQLIVAEQRYLDSI
jgi:NDP-sugar pyrophosphorylase family protein